MQPMTKLPLLLLLLWPCTLLAQVNFNVINKIPTAEQVAQGAQPYKQLGDPPRADVFGRWYFNGYSSIVGQAAVPKCFTDHIVMFDFPNFVYRPGLPTDKLYTSMRPQIGWLDYTSMYDGRFGVNPLPAGKNKDQGNNMACAGYVQRLDGGFTVHAGHGWAADHLRGDRSISRVNPNGTNGYTQNSSLSFLVSQQRFVTQKQYGYKFYCSSGSIQSRWYPTPLVLPDGRHFVAGGASVQGTSGKCWPAAGNEIFDPKNNSLTYVNWTSELQNDHEHFYSGSKCTCNNSTGRCKPQGGMGGIGCYPFVFLIPNTGANAGPAHVLVLGYTKNQIITVDGRKLLDLPDLTKQIPNFRLLFPHPGTALVLAIPPYTRGAALSFTVVIMGGGTQNWARWRLSSNQVASLRITKRADGSYTAPARWSLETMPFRRTFGDAILLPNKRVVLINGAAEYNPNPRGNKPITTPLLYDPLAPVGSARRFFKYAKTTIARTYHSSAMLTRRGCIFVSGCTECNATSGDAKFNWVPDPGHPVLSYSPYGAYEFRTETFCPHYKYLPSPSVTSPPPRTVRYGRKFRLKFRLPARVSLASVALLSPGAATHGLHFNRMLVELKFRVVAAPTPRAPGTLEVEAPPDGSWAPPTCHQLFLVGSNLAYSEGQWITFQ